MIGKLHKDHKIKYHFTKNIKAKLFLFFSDQLSTIKLKSDCSGGEVRFGISHITLTAQMFKTHT